MPGSKSKESLADQVGNTPLHGLLEVKRGQRESKGFKERWYWAQDEGIFLVRVR